MEPISVDFDMSEKVRLKYMKDFPSETSAFNIYKTMRQEFSKNVAHEVYFFVSFIFIKSLLKN